MYLMAGLPPSSRRSFFDTGIFDTDVFAGLNYYRVDLGSTAQEAFPPTPHRITVPTQLIWGDQDPALGAGPAHLTHRCVVGEYRLEVEGAGHWLQFERPAEVASLLLDWIGRH